MSRKMRFSTLVRDYGPVYHALEMKLEDWLKAHEEGRTATVYSTCNRWDDPAVARVRIDGCVNTICKIAWTKPLPKDVYEIIGMRNSQEAWDLCHRIDRGDD